MSQKRESMYIQNVPKVGISSVVHSKHIDSGNIDVVDNDEGVSKCTPSVFYAQSPDFHKLGLCYYLKILYL